MEDIHDILPPVQVGLDPFIIKIALAVAAVLILAGILYGLFRFFLKKKNTLPGNVLCLPSPLPPLEAALKAISDLETHPGPDLREFYFKLTAIIKKYMGRVFLFHAPEMTTQEFIKAIHRLDLERSIQGQIAEVMEGSDRIKYAGDIPIEKMMHVDLARTREVIIRISEQTETGEDTHV